jgi:hypothetical protein
VATREYKQQYVIQYAPALLDLAKWYSKCAKRIHSMPDPILDAMFEVAIQGNTMHQRVADGIDQLSHEQQNARGEA